MNGILELLLDPFVLKVFGPFGILLLVTSIALYKVFKLYTEAQEKRITEAQSMQKEYQELASDINKTLDLIVSLIANRK
jgi:hypothetical protein